MEPNLLDVKEAAEYVGMSLKNFSIAVRNKNGPVYVKPTPNKNMFYKEHLDAWMLKWEWVDPGNRNILFELDSHSISKMIQEYTTRPLTATEMGCRNRAIAEKARREG